MKRCRGWVALLVFIPLCVVGVWFTLKATAEYPALGEPVSYPVNQVDGFELAIEDPSWSPFKGYTIKWKVTANSEDAYTFSWNPQIESGFEYLERRMDGQWYRLEYSQDSFSFNNLDFSLGGENGSGLEGSIVQKYAHYGTRLEPGNYRVVLRMMSEDGIPHYLAEEFMVK